MHTKRDRDKGEATAMVPAGGDEDLTMEPQSQPWKRKSWAGEMLRVVDGGGGPVT